MKTHRLRLIAVVAALALVLGACGGGDSTSDATQAPPPAATDAPPPATDAPTMTDAPPATEAPPPATEAPPPSGEPRVITIEAVDSEGFSLDRIKAAPGETITVVFKNKDTGSGEPHNWHISLPSEELATQLEEGPDTQEITFVVPGPGEYLYVCDTHLSEMTGTLVVE